MEACLIHPTPDFDLDESPETHTPLVPYQLITKPSFDRSRSGPGRLPFQPDPLPSNPFTVLVTNFMPQEIKLSC